SLLDWSALLMFATPLRWLAARWVQSPGMSRVAAGLALGTWMAYGVAHTLQDAITYYLFNWPEQIWVMLVPIIPLEMLFRCAIAPQFHGGRFWGRVTVAGLDTLTHPVSRLAHHVGIVFEDPETQLIATSVENEVAFALENLCVPRDEIRGRVLAALAAVRLDH